MVKNKNVKRSGIITGIILAILLGTGLIPAQAVEVETVVVLKVTQNGFLDEKGHVISGELEIHQDSHLKIIFEYHDQAGDEHEFGLLYDSGEERYSEPLSEEKPKTEIVFFSGEVGAQFELYCILGCSAMEKLTDLMIVVT